MESIEITADSEKANQYRDEINSHVKSYMDDLMKGMESKNERVNFVAHFASSVAADQLGNLVLYLTENLGQERAREIVSEYIASTIKALGLEVN